MPEQSRGREDNRDGVVGELLQEGAISLPQTWAAWPPPPSVVRMCFPSEWKAQ